jgi:hypothetical protein
VHFLDQIWLDASVSAACLMFPTCAALIDALISAHRVAVRRQLVAGLTTTILDPPHQSGGDPGIAATS